MPEMNFTMARELVSTGSVRLGILKEKVRLRKRTKHKPKGIPLPLLKGRTHEVWVRQSRGLGESAAPRVAQAEPAGEPER